jgi:hypothetical protein
MKDSLVADVVVEFMCCCQGMKTVKLEIPL